MLAIKLILSSTSVTSLRRVSAIALRTFGLISLQAFSRISPPEFTAKVATNERREGSLEDKPESRTSESIFNLCFAAFDIAALRTAECLSSINEEMRFSSLENSAATIRTE